MVFENRGPVTRAHSVRETILAAFLQNRQLHGSIDRPTLVKAHGRLLYKPPLDRANQKYHRRPDMRLKMSLWTANIPATLLFFAAAIICDSEYSSKLLSQYFFAIVKDS